MAMLMVSVDINEAEQSTVQDDCFTAAQLETNAANALQRNRAKLRQTSFDLQLSRAALDGAKRAYRFALRSHSTSSVPQTVCSSWSDSQASSEDIELAECAPQQCDELLLLENTEFDEIRRALARSDDVWRGDLSPFSYRSCSPPPCSPREDNIYSHSDELIGAFASNGNNADGSSRYLVSVIPKAEPSHLANASSMMADAPANATSIGG